MNVNKDYYMEHMVEQNQELSDKINNYELIIKSKNQEIKEIKDEYSKYKLKIKKFILE